MWHKVLLLGNPASGWEPCFQEAERRGGPLFLSMGVFADASSHAYFFREYLPLHWQGETPDIVVATAQGMHLWQKARSFLCRQTSPAALEAVRPVLLVQNPGKDLKTLQYLGAVYFPPALAKYFPETPPPPKAPEHL